MRKFNENIYNEIVRELAFIWSAHRIHKLHGKMRLFTPTSKKDWNNADAGIEIWFGPHEIKDVIKKIKLFYREGKEPNSTYILDPIVYDTTDKTHPRPLGSGIIWGTIIFPEGKKLNDDAIKRLKDLHVFISPIHHNNDEFSGLKILGYLKKPAEALENSAPKNGNSIQGIQDLADLADISSTATFSNHYLISGLEYRSKNGTYQSPSFDDLYGDKEFASSTDIQKNSIYQQTIIEAGTCWNAYERVPLVYNTYGSDIHNLENNLQDKAKNDAITVKITNELSAINQSNKRVGLTGKMRIFSLPSQDTWRSKKESFEYWFDENNTQQAAKEIGKLYNGGKLPNTPIMLDPIVYKQDESGSYKPVGCSIAWASGISVGLEKSDSDSIKRIKTIGLLTGTILRAKSDDSGVKALGFLDKAYLFSDKEIEQYETRNKKRIFAAPTCQKLFDIVNCNGIEYFNTYMISGIEYLCTNGSFTNLAMDDDFPEEQEKIGEFIEKHTISSQLIHDAAKCWESYDRSQILWERFGIDIEHFDQNLHYYNLCGRDLDILNMTGGVKQDEQIGFEFLVPGWIPKSSITMLVSSGGEGRSSIVHRLALLTATDWNDDEKPTFLGSEIDKNSCSGLTVYFSEDSSSIIHARAQIIDPQNRAKRIVIKSGTDFGKDENKQAKTFAQFIDYLNKLPEVSIIIVDPASKFINGDEEDAEAILEFFDILEEFANKKNCAILIVHHLSRGAKPKNSKEMLDLIRGSETFIDRPRTIIGTYNHHDKTIFGLAKNSIPPGQGMIEGERKFTRKPETLDLIQKS